MGIEFIKEYISWNQVKEDADIITRSILKDNKKYDCIVSLGRGGMILSRLLAENLNIREVHIFNIYSYVDKYSSDIIKIKSFDFKILNNKNVLIVDDVCTTGKTILNIIDIIEKEGYNINYSIATEYYNKNSDKKSSIKPDYYARVYNADDTWLVFPWESE